MFKSFWNECPLLKGVDMEKAIVLRSTQTDSVEADWGSLTWYAGASLGNSQDMTIGRCIIKPGCENPLHSHPNCSEVLVVIKLLSQNVSGFL